MINDEKQFRRNEPLRYSGDYTDYDPRMTASQRAYSGEDYRHTDRRDYKNYTADFEEMLDRPSEDGQEEDLLPTSTTMQFTGKNRNYIYEDLNECEDDEENAEEENVSYKINTKGKIIIAVYALVVLTIFTLIIMNTRLIHNMNTSISESEARIAMMEAENVRLYDELNYVSQETEILKRAEAIGMVAGN